MNLIHRDPESRRSRDFCERNSLNNLSVREYVTNLCETLKIKRYVFQPKNNSETILNIFDGQNKYQAFLNPDFIEIHLVKNQSSTKVFWGLSSWRHCLTYLKSQLS